MGDKGSERVREGGCGGGRGVRLVGIAAVGVVHVVVDGFDAAVGGVEEIVGQVENATVVAK